MRVEKYRGEHRDRMKRKIVTICLAWLSVLFVVGGSRPESCGAESKMAKYEPALISGAVDMVRNKETMKEAFEEEEQGRAEAAPEENAAGSEASEEEKRGREWRENEPGGEGCGGKGGCLF